MDPAHWIDTFGYRLTHICDKFSDIVQILEISLEYEPCLQSVYQVLKNCCPNLKKLRINFEDNEYEPDLGIEILPGPLLRRPNLTLLKVTCEVQVTPSLTSLLQLIVNASPNLRKATIPWGFYPNFANSKRLDSLRVELDFPWPIEYAMEDFKPVELSRLLKKVGDQLVNLTFSRPGNYLMPPCDKAYNFKNSSKTRFKLPRTMSKLQKFENEMVDIFQHQRLDIERLPALKTLRIGKILEKSRRVDKLLENLYKAEKVFTSVENLAILEIQDPKLLDGLKTAFPNLKRLELDTRCKKYFKGELGEMLNTCKGLEGLKYLHLMVSTFSEPRLNIILTLLDSAELYKELKVFEILIFRGTVRGDLTEEEMDLFKKLLVAMNGMDRVTIHNFHVGEESRKKILDFMVSNTMSVSKFELFRGG
ncbi:hypothetical protein Fcan01_10498 [Folsomia candida]|uniref:Uncharacterized protein n=2 Tax=Folsomia candida TaxID=158441 RepID=A0A226EAP6_FOLCA|nr:hypothetical protein Fcan01_10498 [Folsomia candida]